MPPPLLGSNTSASGQQRGGQGSGTNPDGPDGPGSPTTNNTASGPTQTGITKTCTAFALAGTSDTCYAMSQRFHITLAQLTAWNPVLGYPDGHNCSTQFWTGYDYCVGVSGSSSGLSAISSSSMNLPLQASATSKAASSLPHPTQSGIVSSCDKFVEAKPGDYCYKFAQDNQITTTELYMWNPILGLNGADCSTKFLAGYDYCVSEMPYG